MRTIVLGDGVRVSISAYVKAVKLAKQNPDQLFDRGLTTEFPTRGRKIMVDFIRGIMDRINQHEPPREDHRGWSARLLRHLKRHGRPCKWCGRKFYPHSLWQQYCSAECL